MGKYDHVKRWEDIPVDARITLQMIAEECIGSENPEFVKEHQAKLATWMNASVKCHAAKKPHRGSWYWPCYAKPALNDQFCKSHGGVATEKSLAEITDRLEWLQRMLVFNETVRRRARKRSKTAVEAI